MAEARSARRAILRATLSGLAIWIAAMALVGTLGRVSVEWWWSIAAVSGAAAFLIAGWSAGIRSRSDWLRVALAELAIVWTFTILGAVMLRA